MAAITPVRQASNQARKLKRLADQVKDMSADWGDWDNYFLQRLTDIADDIQDVSEAMVEYVTESRSGGGE